MKYSNIVRFIPKEGQFDDVVHLLSEPMDGMDGLIQNIIVKVDEKTCIGIGIWESEAHIAAARPSMIKILDRVRDKLELISDELGVTDPASGPVIAEMKL